MTSADWKQYDKKIHEIVDPFGTVVPKLRKLMKNGRLSREYLCIT